MTNPFNRADKHGAPDMRVTPPESAETPMQPTAAELWPRTRGEPTYAELKAQRNELMAALELMAYGHRHEHQCDCYKQVDAAIAKAKPPEIHECKFCGKAYKALTDLRDHQT